MSAAPFRWGDELPPLQGRKVDLRSLREEDETWGRGFASDAVATVIGFSFNAMNLHRLEADADPDNERSLRVLERQGFRRQGYLRERWHHLGELRDTVLLGLLRREWTGGDAAAPNAW